MKTAVILSVFCLLSGLNVSAASPEAKEASKQQSYIHDAYLACRDSFSAGGEWFLYPAYRDRDAWNKLIDRNLREKLIKTGEKYLDYRYVVVPASTFLNLRITGDKQEMRKVEKANREAFISVMLAELAEGKGRFLLAIADGLWYYGTAFHWSHSNQTRGSLPSHDGEKVALGNVRLGVTVPLCLHLFRDEIDKYDKSICAEVEKTVERIIIDPYLGSDETWMGFSGSKTNNWNPWCNHGVAYAALLVEKDNDKLHRVLDKATRSVDIYFNSLTDDGCCEEGSTYWAQAIPRLCEFLDLLEKASGGKCSIRPNAKLTAISTYTSRMLAARTADGRGCYANFGDASAIITPNVYLAWMVGKFTGSPELRNYALYFCGDGGKRKFSVKTPSADEGFRAMDYLLSYKEMSDACKALNARMESGEDYARVSESLREGIPAVTTYPDVHQIAVRTDGGWFIGARYGFPGIQHGHNDVGNLVLYVGPEPVLCDAGVATYTAETFGPKRFSIWSIRSDWHSCPAPNGTVQVKGFEHGDRDCTCITKGSVTTFSADIAAAYPEEAACLKYVRKMVFDRKSPEHLVIEDSWSLKERKAPDKLYFLTPGKVSDLGKGKFSIRCGTAEVTVSYSQNLTLNVEDFTPPEPSMKKKWPEGLRRIILSSAPDAPLQGNYTVKFR